MAVSIATNEQMIPFPKSNAPAAPLDDANPTPQLMKVVLGRKQLEHEWEENRIALKWLQEYHLCESAIEIQRRALEIRPLMAGDSWTNTEEHDEMRETLADILLECDGDTSQQQEALRILQEQLEAMSTESRTRNATNTPSSLAQTQKRNRLQLKLGKAYKDTGQLERAKQHLRAAFDAYESENPRDVRNIQSVGQHLLQLHEIQVHEGDRSQRPVLITQWRAFRKELQTALGPSLSECAEARVQEAVDWCKLNCAIIQVSKVDQGYRFDIIDQECETSPLHIAAEKCQDDTALQQMIENSDTLERLDREQETPLLVAVGKSNTTAIELLLKYGASVRARDKERQTVLHKSQQPGITKLLLRHSLRRPSAATISTIDTRQFRSDSVSSSATTCTLSKTTTSSTFASGDDLEIDAQDCYRQTALWIACAGGRVKTVSLLLAARASPHIFRYKTSPLAAVIESNADPYINDPERRVKIIQALIRAGADPEPGKQLLRKPRGPEKRILRALEGQLDAFPPPLSGSRSYDISSSSSSGRASVDPLPLSPISTAPLSLLGVDSTMEIDFSKLDT